MKICKQRNLALSMIGGAFVTLFITNAALASCIAPTVIVENDSGQTFLIETKGSNLNLNSTQLSSGAKIMGKLANIQGDISGVIVLKPQEALNGSKTIPPIEIPYSFSTGSLITQPCLPKTLATVNISGLVISSHTTKPTAGGRNAIIKYTISK